MRGLSFRGLTEADSGTYSVKVVGPHTDLYSSCRVNVIGEPFKKWRGELLTNIFLKNENANISFQENIFSNLSAGLEIAY